MFTNINKPLFTFVKSMEMEDLYRAVFCADLKGRYIALDHLEPLLKTLEAEIEISVVGYSENRLPIKMLRFGSGKKKVLAWSQMHGNESTTTKAILDLSLFLIQKDSFQKEIQQFLELHTLYVIPMLNPDGAGQYTRENANNIDLNRDALALSQSESRVLRATFDSIKPDLCLNLHDQRSIYGLDIGKPATVSFLAPAADSQRRITSARKIAMTEIVRMVQFLERFIPGQIGRYDDSFNENCVGDSFTKEGVPTILFEAGHFRQDYQREQTRKYVFYAFLALFGLNTNSKEVSDYSSYFDIPENKVNFKDVLIRNIRLAGQEECTSIAIQYTEVLIQGKIHFRPIVDTIGSLEGWYGHREIMGKGREVLMNYQQKQGIGEEIATVLDRKTKIPLFPTN